MGVQRLRDTWDQCVQNMFTNVGWGAACGFLFAVMISARKTPFAIYGAGLGTGYSYVLCDQQFKAIPK